MSEDTETTHVVGKKEDTGNRLSLFFNLKMSSI